MLVTSENFYESTDFWKFGYNEVASRWFIRSCGRLAAVALNFLYGFGITNHLLRIWILTLMGEIQIHLCSSIKPSSGSLQNLFYTLFHYQPAPKCKFLFPKKVIFDEKIVYAGVSLARYIGCANTENMRLNIHEPAGGISKFKINVVTDHWCSHEYVCMCTLPAGWNYE